MAAASANAPRRWPCAISPLRIDATRPSITGVVGESGSGKSTMARLLLGLETPTAGQRPVPGPEYPALRGADRRTFRQDVQAIFQDPFESFNSLYKVDHMLEVPIQKFKLARTKEETRQMMVDALDGRGAAAGRDAGALSRTS